MLLEQVIEYFYQPSLLLLMYYYYFLIAMLVTWFTFPITGKYNGLRSQNRFSEQQ